MLSPIVDPFIVQDAHLYNFECLGQNTKNIEKHASEPLYAPNDHHPHHEYNHLQNLIIEDKYLEPQMKRLKQYVMENDKEVQEGKVNWLDRIKVSDIQCKCPNKVGYEKILALNEPDQKQDVLMYKDRKSVV